MKLQIVLQLKKIITPNFRLTMQTNLVIKTFLLCTLLTLSLTKLFAQKNNLYTHQLEVLLPLIWNNVTVKDNFIPPTSPVYKEYRSGSALGYGINLNYSFQPSFIFKNKKNVFAVSIGGGYFNQRFKIVRPFNYNSPIYILYYTKHYSYECLQGAVGLRFNQPLRKEYFLVGSITYSIFKSFQQNYTPTDLNNSIQTNRNQIAFGNSFVLGLGIDKKIGKKISLGLKALIPLYTQWRNDKIFNDSPSTFYRPGFSFGSSINVSYNFKK